MDATTITIESKIADDDVYLELLEKEKERLESSRKIQKHPSHSLWHSFATRALLCFQTKGREGGLNYTELQKCFATTPDGTTLLIKTNRGGNDGYRVVLTNEELPVVGKHELALYIRTLSSTTPPSKKEIQDTFPGYLGKVYFCNRTLAKNMIVVGTTTIQTALTQTERSYLERKNQLASLIASMSSPTQQLPVLVNHGGPRQFATSIHNVASQPDGFASIRTRIVGRGHASLVQDLGGPNQQFGSPPLELPQSTLSGPPVVQYSILATRLVLEMQQYQISGTHALGSPLQFGYNVLASWFGVRNASTILNDPAFQFEFCKCLANGMLQSFAQSHAQLPPAIPLPAVRSLPQTMNQQMSIDHGTLDQAGRVLQVILQICKRTNQNVESLASSIEEATLEDLDEQERRDHALREAGRFSRLEDKVYEILDSVVGGAARAPDQGGNTLKVKLANRCIPTYSDTALRQYLFDGTIHEREALTKAWDGFHVEDSFLDEDDDEDKPSAYATCLASPSTKFRAFDRSSTDHDNAGIVYSCKPASLYQLFGTIGGTTEWKRMTRDTDGNHVVEELLVKRRSKPNELQIEIMDKHGTIQFSGLMVRDEPKHFASKYRCGDPNENSDPEFPPGVAVTLSWSTLNPKDNEIRASGRTFLLVFWETDDAKCLHKFIHEWKNRSDE